MNNLNLIFVHGWGCIPDFWDDLARELSASHEQRINLRFLDEGDIEAATHDLPAIYITHSLGTMWALKHRLEDISALISINGFACFKDLSDERTLKSMKINLKRNAPQQMAAFWRQAGLPQSNSLNIPRLKEGLEWLMTWDYCQELNALTCPILSLIGEEDKIAPFDPMQQHWYGYDIKTCTDGGHALPATHTQWCAKHIRTFIDAL